MLKPLVSGGMAEVLLARAQGMGGFAHHVVIKAIRANKSMEPSFIKAFIDEARLSASLHHHHIVQVHDVGREGDDYFFAMEYVHGENLRRLLTKIARAREVLPLDQVITIMLAVAAGLHHAHQQNIVHRDVTPANILIGYDGNIKVTDFGIAKALLKSSELTRSGTMRGKVAYMAPEQCLGRPIDRRSDIFSLGIVLYELCTARRLFKGDTDFLVMTSIVNGKIPKPTLHRADLPIDLEDVILKALAPKPELRFATAEDFGMALEEVAARHGIRISSTALAEYLTKLFGTRSEPWLVDDRIDIGDVDFDGKGTGLVEIDDEPSNPAVERELLESPILAAQLSPPDRNEFSDDQRTEIEDGEDDEPPTLTGGASPPATSGFEANEQTLIGDEADVDMLVNLSKIEARRDTTPVPRRDTTPVPSAPARHDATPLPTGASAHEMSARRDATPTPTAPARRDATPTAPARRDATPMPTTPARRDATPLPTGASAHEMSARRDATPTPTAPARRDATPMPTTPTRRDATPTAPARRDATPMPTAPARRDATPTAPARRDATPMPTTPARRDATPMPTAPAMAAASTQDPTAAGPQWAASPSGTGTPMAWAPQDSEVISLAPKGRRFMLIAAVAVPLVVIGVFLITRDGDSGTAPAKTVEPDAYVEPVTIDAAAASTTPDAAFAGTPDTPDAAFAVTPDATATVTPAVTPTATPAVTPASKVVRKPASKKPAPKKPARR